MHPTRPTLIILLSAHKPLTLSLINDEDDFGHDLGTERDDLGCACVLFLRQQLYSQLSSTSSPRHVARDRGGTDGGGGDSGRGMDKHTFHSG